ncbi:MAG: hypothetical protein ACRCRT_06745 [Cetobacterium somerae]
MVFIPKQINVGFQNRSGTYTGKLAYIIYIDEKGVLRKEKSWEGWRDKKINPMLCNNEPTEGFVLNKKAGGYASGWNHRQTYTRVYDPRGFEFEITIPNLLYILEHTNCIKGKGLEGEFVYGWDGQDLWLLPCSAPDTQNAINESNKLFCGKEDKLTTKDLIVGHTYIKKNREKGVYIGKRKDSSGKNKHVFVRPVSWFDYSLTSGVGAYVSHVDDNYIDNLPVYLEAMDYLPEFNKLDRDKGQFIDLRNNIDLAYEALNYIYRYGHNKGREHIYDEDITYYNIAYTDVRYEDPADFKAWTIRRPSLFELLCKTYNYNSQYYAELERINSNPRLASIWARSYPENLNKKHVEELLNKFRYIIPIKDIFENGNLHRVHYSTSKLYGKISESPKLSRLKERLK